LIFEPLVIKMTLMKMIPVIHSSFPRIGERPEEQKLRRSYAGLEEGKISQAEFESVQNQVVDDILDIQEKAGIEVATDGLIRRYDPASHLARNFKGFEINGLLRFFDTNFYYRQPVARESITESDGILSDEIRYAVKKSKKPVKGIILGPLSLASMSLNKTSRKYDDFCLSLGELLGKAAAKMTAAGAGVIQVEEPWLVRNPEHFDLFMKAFGNLIREKGKAKILLTFYFGDTGRIIERLNEIPADMIGIDFTYSPGLVQKISSEGFSGNMAFGILDGRNTKMESASEVSKTLERMMKKTSGSEYHVTTSCGLEFLPKTYAIKKLELTSQVAALVNG